jgi:hypothetical protein
MSAINHSYDDILWVKIAIVDAWIASRWISVPFIYDCDSVERRLEIFH